MPAVTAPVATAVAAPAAAVSTVTIIPVYGTAMRGASSAYSPYSPDHEEEFPVFDYGNMKRAPPPVSAPVMMPVSAPAPVEEEEEEVFEQVQEVAERSVVVERVRVNGSFQEGETVRAVGITNPDATFQWASRGAGASEFSSIPNARDRTYVPTKRDVGCVLQVTATSGAETSTAYTDVIQPAGPRLVDIRVEGGPYHTHPLSVSGEYVGGREGMSQIQWLRADHDNDFFPIEGADGRAYQPTADDLHAKIRVEYTAYRDDGTRGPTARVDVDPDFLTIDPTIAKKVEATVKHGDARFTVVQKMPGGSDEPREIHCNSKSVSIRKGGKVKAKCSYHPLLAVNLSRSNPAMFELEFSDREIYAFTCADIKERDEIALVVRSFLSVHVLHKGKVGLHRVQSLTELRAQERDEHNRSGVAYNTSNIAV